MTPTTAEHSLKLRSVAEEQRMGAACGVSPCQYVVRRKESDTRRLRDASRTFHCGCNGMEDVEKSQAESSTFDVAAQGDEGGTNQAAGTPEVG